MQVHDTPLALDAKGTTQLVTVGAGGADIYYGPSPATATRVGGGTLAAAGTSFTITGTTWVVRSDQSVAPAADVSVVEAAPSADSGLAVSAAAADTLLFGTLTRDTVFGTVTSGGVLWPDGATGTYTATLDVNGNVASYTVTHVLGGRTKTFTQPTMTRDANGAVTARPAITVT